MLRHARGQVRMMMLHSDQSNALPRRPLPRVTGRGVIWVKVVREAGRCNAEQILIKRYILLEGPERLVVIEVAQVMAEKRLSPASERERPLELAANR